MGIGTFSNQIGCLYLFIQIKMKMLRDKVWRYYLPKDVLKISAIINGKMFYDQLIDSDIKRHK